MSDTRIETAPPDDTSSAPEPTSAAPAQESAAPPPLPGFLEGYDPDPSGSDANAPVDYEALLNHDPFAPKKPEAPAAPVPATPAPQAPPAAPGGQVPAGQVQVQPAAPPAAAPAPDPRDLELSVMREQLASLRGVLEQVSRVQQPQAQAPQQAQSAAPAEPQVETPPYRYNIPAEWVEGLNSEDPAVRTAHLANLLTGVSQVIHRELVQHTRREMQEAFTQNVPSQVNQVLQQREQARTVEQDYYGKYQHHANFRPFVAQITRQVFAETGAQGWSSEVRDMIGGRVQAVLQAALTGNGSGPVPAMQAAPVGVQVPQAPVAQAQGVPKAPHVFGGIASPGVGVGASALNPNSPEGIADALTVW